MGVVQAACTDAIAVQQRRLLVDLVGRAGLADDPPDWIEEVEKVAVRALEARGGATAAELAKDDPRLAQQIVLAEGKPYEGRQSVVSRILLLLAAEGRIVRGRPRGSWVSGQYRWSVVDAWLPDGVPPWSLREAQAELVRRWLRGFGPATIADLKWWTGLPMGQVRRAVAETGAVEVDLDGTPGLVLPDDLDPVPAPEPWVALLPLRHLLLLLALDPTDRPLLLLTPGMRFLLAHLPPPQSWPVDSRRHHTRPWATLPLRGLRPEAGRSMLGAGAGRYNTTSTRGQRSVMRLSWIRWR
jgi:hypothetical protein